MKMEFLKLRKQSYIKLLAIVLIVAAVLLTITSIQSLSFIESPESPPVKGLQAISLLKENSDKIKGEVTVKKLNDVLKFYKAIPDKEQAYLKTDLKYPGYFHLLNEAYTNPETGEDQLQKITNANDFYDRNKVLLKEKMRRDRQPMSEEVQQEVLQRAESIEKPYHLEYFGHWNLLFKTMIIIGVISVFIAIFIGARLFSYEVETGMDVIIRTLKDRTLRTFALNKILSMSILLTILFLGTAIGTALLFFSVRGFDGASSPIQLNYFTSIYPLTFFQTLVLIILVEWIAILAIGMIVSFVNVLTLRSFYTIIISGLIVLIPALFAKFSFLPSLLIGLFRGQPINSLSVIHNLMDYRLYSVFGIHVLGMTKILFTSVFFIVLGIIAIPVLFTKKLRNHEG